MNRIIKNISFICLLFTNLITAAPASAQSKEAYLIEGMHFGFFANFGIVLGALEEFELGKSRGVVVSFNQGHCYFDESIGPNWWEYYFEPLAVGETDHCIVADNPKSVEWTLRTRWSMPKTYAHYLIEKYIKIKAEIVEELEEFCSYYNFDQQYMIGIHYRGTDKLDKRYAEADFISYEDILWYALKEKKRHPNAKFFIATDEQNFIDAAIKKLGDDIIYHQEIRSTTQLAPHNMEEIPNYTKGKDALMNCLLLSRCNVLIRTSSNLSCASVFFNPDIKVINTNYPDSIHWKM